MRSISVGAQNLTELAMNEELGGGTTPPVSEGTAFPGDDSASSHNTVMGVEGYAFKAAPNFTEQLIEAGQGKRSTAHINQVSWVTPDGQWQIGEGYETATEGEMLLEVDTFLAAGVAAAREAGDEDAAQRAITSMREMTFIGTPEMEEAVPGLANYWATYLQADPSNTIVFFSPTVSGDRHPRSVDYVGGAIAQALRMANPELADRVRLYAGNDESVFDGLQAERTKVVIPDDWMSTGAMITADAKQVATQLRRSGHPELIKQIEANLVVARDDQLQKPLNFITKDDILPPERQVLPIVAYYHTSATQNGMYVWGNHSSVDHNDSFLRQLAQYQAMQTGQAVKLPHAVLTQRPYHLNG